MHPKKNILIICSSALFYQSANGAGNNLPQQQDGVPMKIPELPVGLCKGDKKGGLRRAVWTDSALCAISQPGRFKWLFQFLWALSSNLVPKPSSHLRFDHQSNHHQFIVTGEVVNFRVQCEAATYVDFSVKDCCMPGDHWQLKGKVWDTFPNTAVTTSPGDATNSAGSVSRLYN